MTQHIALTIPDDLILRGLAEIQSSKGHSMWHAYVQLRAGHEFKGSAPMESPQLAVDDAAKRLRESVAAIAAYRPPSALAGIKLDLSLLD